MGQSQLTYRRSHALLIGIDNYQRFPPLSTAVKGVRELALVLQEELGFQPENIVTLENEQATQKAIQRSLLDPLSRPEKVSPQDRVLVYFAGHGTTIDKNAGAVGYLIPVDADPEHEDTFIAMDDLARTAAEHVYARHVLFLLDACFSGFATTRIAEGGRRELADLLRIPSRQVITAGMRDQVVSDTWGPGGHSLFTGFLIDGLRGAAPMPGGILRTSLLAGYLQDQVTRHSHSRQTPQYACLMGSQGGDFVFAVREVSQLPDWVLSAANSPDASERLIAAGRLRQMATDTNRPHMAGQALARLEELSADRDAVVRASAGAALRELMPRAEPAPQEREVPLIVQRIAAPPPEKTVAVPPGAKPVVSHAWTAAPVPVPNIRTTQPRPTSRLQPRNWSPNVIMAGLIGLALVIGGLALGGAFNSGHQATPTPITAEALTEAPETEVAPAPAIVFDRAETLYTGGKQWGPVSTWNPFQTVNYATGTLGLVYETLFIYDPLTDKFTPWLAESGSWTDSTTYELKVRQGITWSDGQPLTADDVKYTFEMGKTNTLFFSSMWQWLTSIDKVDANTLHFTFKDPLYQEWANYLYNVPIVPAHIWSNMDQQTIETGANEKPVGSGAYLYESSDDTRMVWVRNDNWWAIKALKLNVAPRRIVDLVNTSNETSLGLLMQGKEDLNNNYLPGVSNLVEGGYGISTYYKGAPYHLAACTSWLEINLKKKPMDDVAFRKALAQAINVGDIVTSDYANMVQASNPTGLLPIWNKYVDQDVVNTLGTTYDPAAARQTLADAGYKDINRDGFVEAPDGSTIALTITVPNGWSDWMTAIQIISKNLQDVGINVQPDYPEYDDYLAARLQSTFDLTIDNQAQLSNTPWSYYRFIFYDQLADIATTKGGNYGRYDNQKAFDLVTQLDKTPIDRVDDMKKITSQLQVIQLTDLPIIPLWYNGAWAQFSSEYWTGWPSGADGGTHNFPVTWNGYWNMTGIMMLTNLKPVQPN